MHEFAQAVLDVRLKIDQVRKNIEALIKIKGAISIPTEVGEECLYIDMPNYLGLDVGQECKVGMVLILDGLISVQILFDNPVQHYYAPLEMLNTESLMEVADYLINFDFVK